MSRSALIFIFIFVAVACARTELPALVGVPGRVGDADATGGDAPPGDANPGDATSTGDADDVTWLDGEPIELFDGWSVSVYRDLSAGFDYDPADFIDSPSDDNEPLNNMPSFLLLLDDPFPEGLVIVAGRQLLVLQPPDTALVYDYTPSVAEGEGPDTINAITWVPPLADFGNQSYLLLGSCSLDAGDGLYGVATDWSLTRLSTRNNVRALVFDATGTFDGVGSPTLYWGLDEGMYAYPTTDSSGTNVLPAGEHKWDCVLLPASAQLACVGWHDVTQNFDLVTIDSGTHASTTLITGALWIGLATGALSRLPGELYATAGDSFSEVTTSGTVNPVARTLQPGEWAWIDAVVPPADHVLGTELAVYVLEFHYLGTIDIDRVRILRLSRGVD